MKFETDLSDWNDFSDHSTALPGGCYIFQGFVTFTIDNWQFTTDKDIKPICLKGIRILKCFQSNLYDMFYVIEDFGKDSILHLSGFRLLPGSNKQGSGNAREYQRHNCRDQR